jgi:hypothetical protein
LHWPVEKATLFIQGIKVILGMKQQLASQLSDGKLKDYIIEKEKWTRTGKSISLRRASTFGTREGKTGGTTVGRNLDACVMHQKKTGYTY